MPEGKSGRLLTVRQLASRLGVSQSWIYGAVEIGVKRNGRFVRLPCYRCGVGLRFNLEAVLQFLKVSE